MPRTVLSCPTDRTCLTSGAKAYVHLIQVTSPPRRISRPPLAGGDVEIPEVAREHRLGGALEQLRPAGTERQKQGSSNGKTEQMLYAIKYLGTYREKITRATGFEVTSSLSRKESSYKTVQSSRRKNTPPPS